ncbi:suppressor APC domain-containing protein 2-like [Acipenser ruthenus]|uniref:suppressor APC domain-containing protein 2-like n=1 Tax=Acipenser ruthenus TaxID=7906 RepID=UPI002740C2DF|nr:suppressor APC domain-containing protein 2-like [Acipenser ruthenus]
MALIAPDRSSKFSTASRITENTASTMQRKEADFSTDGLPRAFLQSLRTLFDILDDSRRGYVHISEIESRWQGAETRELPGGVLECLRKVAPAHGCLSFERFVAGLRFSLLNPENKHQASPLKQHQQAPRQKTHPHPQHGSTANSSRANENSGNKVRPLGPSNSNGPNPHHTRPRHNEKPQPHTLYSSSLTAEHLNTIYPPDRKSASPPVPGVRYASNGRSLERVPVLHEAGPYRTGKQQQQRVRSTESLALESGQTPKSGAPMPRSQSETVTGLAAVRRHGRGRDEQRRHTITNGVDYGMLKRMKELEQEKDSLLQGLEMVEHAREWYHQQVQAVQERQKHMGKHSSSNDFSEASQSRLTHLLPKLQDVNRCLGDLMSSSGQPCTSSPSAPDSLAPPAASNPQHATSSLANPHQAINMLKDQNRLLTKEVTDKSERITQLEQEKSALIKQLFEARAQSNHETSALDSTFI